MTINQKFLVKRVLLERGFSPRFDIGSRGFGASRKEHKNCSSITLCKGLLVLLDLNTRSYEEKDWTLQNASLFFLGKFKWKMLINVTFYSFIKFVYVYLVSAASLKRFTAYFAAAIAYYNQYKESLCTLSGTLGINLFALRCVGA